MDKQNNPEFTYASLFSGIGGFEQGLNSLGGKCIFSSEIDKMTNISYELIYKEKTAGDITKVDAKDVPDHDLLVGGFPCQAFSIAGKRAGFEDARGTLFFDAMRIAKEKKPKVMILENVKNLLSHDKGNTIKVMLELLSSIGYVTDFSITNSKNFGIPQNRERVYIIAVREDLIEEEEWVQSPIKLEEKRKNELKHIKSFNFDFSGVGPLTTSMIDFLDKEYDEKYIQTYPVHKHLKPLSTEKVDTPYHVLNFNFTTFESSNRVYGVNGIAPTITTMDGGTSKLKIILPDGTIRKIMPQECLRLQGFSEEVINTLREGGVSERQLYRHAGNAVVVNVVKVLGGRILERMNLIKSTENETEKTPVPVG